MSLPDPDELHRNAIVIDAVAPLLRNKALVSWYAEGGVTAVAPTVAIHEDAGQALSAIGGWLSHIRSNPRLLHVRTASDIVSAKASGRIGIILHFQGSEPIGGNLDLLDAFKALGVGIIQLAYNVRNRLGDGAGERTDSGLSRFGMEFVRRCNETGIIVDCSHTGFRSTMEAMEVSDQPVIFSHANAVTVHPSHRNITDEQIRAVAGTGGVVGVVGFPGFVSGAARPSLDQFIDHIDHIAGLVGIEHVGLGIDYYPGQHRVADEADARAYYEASLASGRWSSEAYPPPPHYYPEGIETPQLLPLLTERLVERGYSADMVKCVLGGNWMRVYGEVWGD